MHFRQVTIHGRFLPDCIYKACMTVLRTEVDIQRSLPQDPTTSTRACSHTNNTYAKTLIIRGFRTRVATYGCLCRGQRGFQAERSPHPETHMHVLDTEKSHNWSTKDDFWRRDELSKTASNQEPRRTTTQHERNEKRSEDSGDSAENQMIREGPKRKLRYPVFHPWTKRTIQHVLSVSIQSSVQTFHSENSRIAVTECSYVVLAVVM